MEPFEAHSSFGEGGEQTESSGKRARCRCYRIRQPRDPDGCRNPDSGRRCDRTSYSRRTAEATEFHGVTSMSVPRIARRIARVEQVLCPRADCGNGTYTFEELCRSVWRQDSVKFRKLAEHSMAALLIPQFEREDALAADAVSRNRSVHQIPGLFRR